MTKEQWMMETARGCGIYHAVFMDTADLEFEHDLRKYCEQNLCGNYGKNYACPPDCGTPQEMEKKVRAYRRALVLQGIYPLPDVTDAANIKRIRRTHNGRTKALVRACREAGIEGMAVMAGPCALCSPCRREEGKPCPRPSECDSCLSAYCIRAEKMAGRCGMTYWCEKGSVAFFSIYLVDRTEDMPRSFAAFSPMTF